MDAGKVALTIICIVAAVAIVGLVASGLAGMYCFDHC